MSSTELPLHATPAVFSDVDSGTGPHHGRTRPLPYLTARPTYSESAAEARELQEATATFIPTLTRLRQICREHTHRKLLALDREIDSPTAVRAREKLLDEAVVLLRQLDEDKFNEVRAQELEDPAVAKARGVSIVHFSLDTSSQHRDWVMINRTSNTIVENASQRSKDGAANTPSCFRARDRERLEEFAAYQNAPLRNAYYKRARTTAEDQPGAVVTDKTGRAVPRVWVTWLWKLILVLVVLGLTALLGVGIIATNSTFSPAFRAGFFWIAIAWTLVSSTLLAWLVRALGGDRKDILSGFLAAIGIWLVVIQVGV